jgi:gamma-D-glutamyl-L-lysine dipeptidyl-peptidase
MASDATSSTLPAGSAERVVAVPVAELRRRPDHRGECVTECPIGSRLHVLDDRDEARWLHVRCPDGYRAWIRSWATVPFDRRRHLGGLYVRAANAAVRNRPDRRASIVSPIPMGGRLVPRAARGKGRWRAVLLPDGRTGWIAREEIDSDALPQEGGFWGPCGARETRPDGSDFARASVARSISRARDLLGVPYRWGGVTSWGIDCSGLVRLVLGLEGIPIPRDAGDQYRAVERWRCATAPGSLRAGDLVFFGSPLGSVDHVGFGLGGRPGRFIHASGTVRISGLNRRDRLFELALRERVQAIIRPPYGP